MVQGLLQLLVGDPLLFEEEFANTNGHENNYRTLHMMTKYVNHDSKCQSQVKSPAFKHFVVSPSNASVQEHALLHGGAGASAERPPEVVDRVHADSSPEAHALTHPQFRPARQMPCVAEGGFGRRDVRVE